MDSRSTLMTGMAPATLAGCRWPAAPARQSSRAHISKHTDLRCPRNTQSDPSGSRRRRRSGSEAGPASGGHWGWRRPAPSPRRERPARPGRPASGSASARAACRRAAARARRAGRSATRNHARLEGEVTADRAGSSLVRPGGAEGVGEQALLGLARTGELPRRSRRALRTGS